MRGAIKSLGILLISLHMSGKTEKGILFVCIKVQGEGDAAVKLQGAEFDGGVS